MPAPPYSTAATTYAAIWFRFTRRPMIRDAVGLAPTAWNRRPNVVNRNTTISTSVTTTPTQNVGVTPRNRDDDHAASPSGTGRWIALLEKYRAAIPRTICPTASVTISEFNPRPPTRIPFTRPTSAERTSATTIAVTTFSSEPWPTP